MLNLIDDAWLPVVRQSGKYETISAADLALGFADDPIVALNFQRPDWNSAITEWLIGIYAVADPIAHVDHWFDRWEAPLTPDAARDALTSLSGAFNLLGPGARCFQDFDPLDERSANGIDQLLIHTPGANTAKLNQDFFFKRRPDDHKLSLADAAAALVTLQTYAPSGGAGHRTSMRGGGPLTSLVRPLRRSGLATLYDLVLANQPRGLGKPPIDALVFPWLAETVTSRKGEVIIPEDCHALQAFFGMPRRIRLIGDKDAVTGFKTAPYGVSYKAWRHPLSPYYYKKDKKEWLPRHPREGDTTFRDWPTIWGLGEEGRVASCIGAFEDIIGSDPLDFDILASGYDMADAAARAWQQSSIPYFLHAGTRECAGQMIAAAREAASALRFAIKRVMFGQVREKDGKTDIYLSEQVKPSAGIEYAVELERSLENVLTEHLRRIDIQQSDQTETVSWHNELFGMSLRIFDRVVDVRQAPIAALPLIVRARKGLRATFGTKGKVTKTLLLVEYLKAQKANQKEEVIS